MNGVLILLPGLAGMALAAWGWWASATNDEPLAVFGFYIAAFVAVVSTPPLVMGLWLLLAPGPRAATVGALLSGAYGVAFGYLLLTVTDGLSRAISLMVAWMCVLAAARLVMVTPWRFARFSEPP